MLVTDSHFLVCHPEGLTTVWDELWGVKIVKSSETKHYILVCDIRPVGRVRSD